jgi:hypothetical protein
MMTDQQREAAARELCRLRGLNPDERVSIHCDSAFGVVYASRLEVTIREVQQEEERRVDAKRMDRAFSVAENLVDLRVTDYPDGKQTVTYDWGMGMADTWVTRMPKVQS